ncbi:MAG: hypothetical protein R3350_08570 [Saprospiraceae bacterium]|nr:hypothetical protein [Saprospiraceae bacterium]
MAKFKETQRFRKWELFAVLAVLSGGALFRTVQILYTQGLSSPREIMIGLSALLVLGVSIYILSRLRATVKVGKKGITYKVEPWYPQKEKIKWKEIQSCKIIDLSPLASLSGWAVHFDSRERGFNFGNNKGVILRLQNGERYFLGIRDLETLKPILKEMIRKKAG